MSAGMHRHSRCNLLLQNTVNVPISSLCCLQWEHRDAEMALDRSDWPPVAVVSARHSAAALEAVQAVRDAAYGRSADNAGHCI
jgi:hypothetical protein